MLLRRIGVSIAESVVEGYNRYLSFGRRAAYSAMDDEGSMALLGKGRSLYRKVVWSLRT
jgi:hypothetical protein